MDAECGSSVFGLVSVPGSSDVRFGSSNKSPLQNILWSQDPESLSLRHRGKCRRQRRLHALRRRRLIPLERLERLSHHALRRPAHPNDVRL